MKEFKWILPPPRERVKEFFISSTILAIMLEEGRDPEKEGIPWRYASITNKPIKHYIHFPDEPWRQYE